MEEFVQISIIIATMASIVTTMTQDYGRLAIKTRYSHDHGPNYETLFSTTVQCSHDYKTPIVTTTQVWQPSMFSFLGYSWPIFQGVYKVNLKTFLGVRT